MNKLSFSIFISLLVYIKSSVDFLTLPRPDQINNRKLEEVQERMNFPSENVYYEVKVNLGEGKNKEEFNLAIDLTQSETWINSYSCDSTQRLLQEDITDSTATSTASAEPNTCQARDTNARVESIYGSIEGPVISESVSIGDNIVAKNMSIISATSDDTVRYFKNNTLISGVLGLSYKSFSGPQFSFIDVLKESSSISKRIFALGKGAFHIGDYPSQVKQLPENYHTCNITRNEGFSEELMDGWICDLTHFLIGQSTSFQDAEEIQGRVIIDSMLRNIEAPGRFLGIIKAHYFDLYYRDQNCTIINDINNEFSTRIVCAEAIEEPKNLNLIIGGKALVINGSNLFSTMNITETVDGNSTTKSVSLFNIVFTEQNHNIWRVGKILIDNYLIVFDYEKAQIGFYGENKIDFEKEWQEWWSSGFENITSQEHMKYLIMASACLGAALLFVIICLVCQGLKKKDDEGKAPLHEEEMEHK